MHAADSLDDKLRWCRDGMFIIGHSGDKIFPFEQYYLSYNVLRGSRRSLAVLVPVFSENQHKIFSLAVPKAGDCRLLVHSLRSTAEHNAKKKASQDKWLKNAASLVMKYFKAGSFKYASVAFKKSPSSSIVLVKDFMVKNGADISSVVAEALGEKIPGWSYSVIKTEKSPMLLAQDPHLDISPPLNIASPVLAPRSIELLNALDTQGWAMLEYMVKINMSKQFFESFSWHASKDAPPAYLCTSDYEKLKKAKDRIDSASSDAWKML